MIKQKNINTKCPGNKPCSSNIFFESKDRCIFSKKLLLKNYLLAFVLIMFLYIFLIKAGCCQEENPETSTWEFWPQVHLERKLNDKLKARLTLGSRYHGGTHYNSNVKLSASGKMAKKLKYGFGFTNQYTKSKNKWKAEYRPHFHITPEWNLWKFNFSNRAMLEYRIFNFGGRSYPRFRNKLTISKPVNLKFLRLKFKPYVAEEIFIFPDDTNNLKVGRNRVFAGVKHDFSDSFGVDLYYMRQTDGDLKDSGEIKEVYNVTGLMAMVKF